MELDFLKGFLLCSKSASVKDSGVLRQMKIISGTFFGTSCIKEMLMKFENIFIIALALVEG